MSKVSKQATKDFLLTNIIAISAKLRHDVGVFEKGMKVYSTKVNGYFPCPHGSCDVKSPDKHSWRSHIHYIVTHIVDSQASTILPNDTGIYKEGQKVEIEMVDGLYKCIHGSCPKAFLTKSSWISHVKGIHPSSNVESESSSESDSDDKGAYQKNDIVSVSTWRNVAGLEKGLKLFTKRINGQFPCPHDGCNEKLDDRKSWRNHVNRRKDHDSHKAVSMIFPTDVGNFKAGDKVQGLLNKGSFKCIHQNCSKSLKDKTSWILHVQSEHDKQRTASVSNNRSKTIPTYLKNTNLKLIIDHLDKTAGSRIYFQIHNVALKRLDLKYKQIVSYYFQSRYNNLFLTDESRMNSIRQTLVKQDGGSGSQKRMFGPLLNYTTFIQYKEIFISWITILIRLKDIAPSNLNGWLRELKVLAQNFTLLANHEIFAQEQAFSHSNDISNEVRIILGDGGEIDDPEFANNYKKNSSSKERHMEFYSSENYFRKISKESSAIRWPGANKFKGLNESLECLHNFLLNIIVDSESSHLVLISLIFLLLDKYDSSGKVWKSPEDAKKIVNGLLYGMRLIILTHFEYVDNNLAGSQANDVNEFIKYFLDPATGRFVQPFYSLGDSINNEFK